MFAFLDLEATGLDPEKCAILEIACILCNSEYEQIAPPFVRQILPEKGTHWEEAAHIMHAQNGMIEDAYTRGTSLDRAEQDLVEFVVAAITLNKNESLHLAGNSVHFDRSFLKAHMPSVESFFHHRHLDVSSLRIIGEKFGPKPHFTSNHRALEDAVQSIEELHHWIDVLRGNAKHG